MYYFIKYRWRKIGDTNWNHVNDVTDREPVSVLFDLRVYNEENEYVMDFYHGIDEEYYERYANRLND